MAAMYKPPHPGELLHDGLQAEGLSISDAAARLGVKFDTLSGVLAGTDPVSPHLASALEDLGWSDAEHWLRMQRSSDLTKVRENDAVTSPNDRRHLPQP